MPLAAMLKRFSESIKKEIKRCRRILVVAHVNPDPDAVGSALALTRILRSLGKDVTVYITGFSAERYEGLPGAAEIERREPRKNFDLIFGLDYGRLWRLGIDKILSRSHPVMISIDHHPRQEQAGDIVWLDAQKSSVSEMIYDLAKALNFPIDERTALYLLFGIIGDTVGLSTQSVTSQLLEKVVDLVKRGGSLEKVQTLRQEWASLALMKIAAKAMSRTKIYPKEKLAVSWVRKQEWKENGLDPDALSFVANDLRMIRGVLVSLLLVEQTAKWYGHLRSRAESRVNLGKIAESFGGGGHKNAAGFTSNLPRPKIVSKIRQALR